MYKGAGILLLRKQEGKTIIGLARRAIRPQKNYWSIPGGKMDARDQEDFLRCALRETGEELFAGLPEEMSKIHQLSPAGSVAINIPFAFRWKTYFFDVSDTVMNTRLNFELSEFAWFEIDRLPEKTHYGVVYALWKLRSIKF
jgi:8-oxo-dGTP pyrophosphatase MutT (NUDIX family)